MYRLIHSRFPQDRQKTFLETETGSVYSYADLEATSAQYAHLLSELGVQPGDRVAVQVEKSPESVFLYLACLRAGAIYLPLNPAYTPSEVSYFLSDAEPQVFVCRPGSEAPFKARVAHTLTLGTHGEGNLPERAARHSKIQTPVPVQPSDVAAILYTSGTTGRSKGAMLTHANLASNAMTLQEVWGFNPNDVLLHALPIFHTHGLFVALHCVLLSGSSLLFLPKFDADTILKLLPRTTVFMGVPTFYTRLLSHPGLSRETTSHLRLFISGSAPLLAETHREFEARTGQVILERYGMTETGMLTSNPLRGLRVAGTVGPALPGVELRLQKETGVIEVRGPNVFSGYWRMPEKTREEIRDDGFFITGDVGRIDSNGYVQIVGRAKDLIISGGFNIYPKEIETVIDTLAGVAESAVIGVPHPDFGEAVVAVVHRSSSSGGQNLDEAAVIRECRERLANFKVPKRVHFVDELPRNAMGKVQKNLLRERFA